MAYNRKNYLENVKKLQEFVTDVQNEHPGLPYTKIYTQYVKPQFGMTISYSTFNNWLGIRVSRELEKIEAKKTKTKSN